MPTWQTTTASIESSVLQRCNISVYYINKCFACSLVIENTIIFLQLACDSSNIYAYYTDPVLFIQFHLELLKLPKHTSDRVSQRKLYILIQHYFKGSTVNPLLAVLNSFFHITVNSLHLLLVVAISALRRWDVCCTWVCYANVWTWIRPMGE